MPALPISVLILTKDEEVNLPDCLASVAWCDDVVVFDSGSRDRTAAIAATAGARVVVHPFTDYGSQREAARTGVAWKHPWILALDADERVEPDLLAELHGLAASGGLDRHAAWRMRRKDHFQGRWIRRASLYPSWFVRLLRRDRVRYEARAVHEYPEVDGSIGGLAGHIAHHSFNKGLAEWVAKHARYAELEAAAELDALDHGGVDWAGLASTDPVRRRRALKRLSFHMPCRPTLRLIYMLMLRGALLDGPAGWRYCRLIAHYEYLIVLNLALLRRRRAGLPG